jgi:hypothetical protein
MGTPQQNEPLSNCSGPRFLTNDKCEELIAQLMLTEADIRNSPIGGIFSDGAFTPAHVSPNSLLTHPSQLLQIGHGGIAVVWTPPAENLTTLPTRILHVSVPSNHLHRTTPNTLELLGPIVAYKLSRHVPTHIPAASDCQSVVRFKKHKAIGVVHLGTPPKASSMNPWR